MQSRPNPLLELVDREYFETFDLYFPRKTDFYDPVDIELPRGWNLQRSGIWFYCSSPVNPVPQQGWKIHISATAHDAIGTLKKVLAVLFQRQDTNFKFALDSYVLSLLNGKNWPRGSSGKFITVYPRDSQHFVQLIEELHQATLGRKGPYILSDQRYEENSVVFYRFGAMHARFVLNIAGEQIPCLTGPDGSEIPDRRLPFPSVPNWAEPPISRVEKEEPTGNRITLRNDRYEIVEVLAFSSAGGIYRALDWQTNHQVIIKEARPYIYSADKNFESTELLRKEHRLLQILSDVGIAPQPYDFFQEWEHWFLVEEFVEGVSLASHIAGSNLLLRTRPSPADFDAWHKGLRLLCQNLASLIDILHRRGIVFGDLSPNNILVTDGRAHLKLIDFEGAMQLGVDLPTHLYTPGFASPNQISGSQGTFQDDYYAMGAVISSCLFPLNGLMYLAPDVVPNLVHHLSHDSQVSPLMATMIVDLLSDDPAKRPDPSKVHHILSNPETFDCCDCDVDETSVDYDKVITGIQDHILAHATYSRMDRLFPADAKLFSTNPLSLSYGAAGVAYALNRISGSVPEKALEWILQHDVSNDGYTPGLYVGLAGIAWCLLEVGCQQEAEKIFRSTLSHPLRCQNNSVFYGLAGWGMTALRFFAETHNEEYLDYAREAGTTIVEGSISDQRGRYWTNDGDIRLGLGHGASGIALFLLYLYLATGYDEFLAAGQEALEFDLGFAAETKDGGLSWAHSTGFSSPLYPYWQFGSAGIGRVALRFYKLLREDRLRSILERVFIETDRKYAVFPGQFQGLAGLGEFSLDLFDLFGETRFLLGAEKAARGIMLFRVERNGVAFPGNQLVRLSCDYGTGSAGIALFLNRFLGRQNSNFMLDSLFSNGLTHDGRKAASGTGLNLFR